MSKYSPAKASERIESALNYTLTKEERKSLPSGAMTYESAYSTTVTAVFVDIRKSTSLFSLKNQDVVAGIMRAFTSETIKILDTNNAEEIGIRGDCVYAIYTTNSSGAMMDVFERARKVNSLIRLLNIHYKARGYRSIKAGIGIASSEVLVVKVGSKGNSVNDRIWIGTAVPDAAHLSSFGSKYGAKPIVMTEDFYMDIHEDLMKRADVDYVPRRKTVQGETFYHSDLSNAKIDKWVNHLQEL